VAAFPSVSFLPQQHAVAAVRDLNRVAGKHGTVVAGENHQRVLRETVFIQCIKDQTGAVIELLHIIAIQSDPALAAKLGRRIDWHVRRRKREV